MLFSGRRRSLTVSVLLFLCLLYEPSWQATDQNDVTALRNLSGYWAGSCGNILNSWAGNDPCGSDWAGVTCDNTSTHVTELDLSSCNLTKGIPSTIGSLASLQSLDLSYNQQLGGSLPQELSQLTSLTSLRVINCGLTGSIPSGLGQLKNLAYLSLTQNGLSGKIPSEIGNLGQMWWFDISENNLNGSLPISTANSVGLDNLLSAQHFHFNNNSLSGQIPEEIFELPVLHHLLLNSNAFKGNIPSATLSSAKVLTILRVDNNLLGGPLPKELNYLINLIELHLSNNSFTQTLPDLSAVTNLQLLDVSHNLFDKQEFPDWVYNLTSALTIAMDSTNLTGKLNSTIFSLPALGYLSLSSNSLNGTVSLGNPSSTIQTVDLQDNKFSGYDASSGIKGTGKGLRLAGNPLCATAFSGSAVCQRLTNEPESWPATTNASCHQSCSGGQTLNPNTCSCARPFICHMQLTSPAFSTVNTTWIATFGDEWAQKLTNLSINIDQNQVSIGTINFTDDGRMLFDLLFFPLSGDSFKFTEVETIRSALSRNAIGISEGPYLLRSSDPYEYPPGKGKKTSIGLIIGIVLGAVAVGFIIALIAGYAIRQKKRADKAEISRPFASWGSTTKESGDAPQLKGARWFSLAELRKATNNFSENNEIGQGGYGTVYRAEVPDRGVVAVKRAREGSVQGAVEFKNEIELLSRVHHKNLVGLVGFCYEHGEQALVYEYMPNGTLRDHLLGHSELPLTWEMRVEIALGSARGLAYLHELANPPIIHRDVKSGNILLDEKMVAKVADFGLSKLAPDQGADKSNVSTQVKGTMGYVDPEYYMTNKLSEKSDVYSFGVVLLEILSARTPIERGRYIVREVRTALNKGGMKALEPLLDPFLGDYPPKQLEAILDLALLCVEEVGTGRPTMSEVVKKLEVISGHSQPNNDVHITIEPKKDIYGKEQLEKVKDPSFQYSGEPFTQNTYVEPK